MKVRVLVPLAFLLGALGVGAGGWLLLIQPQRHDAKKLVVQISAAKAELASLRESASGTPVIGASDVFRLAQAMPQADDVAGILVDLGRLARATRMRLVAVRPAPRVTLPDGSAAVPISVTVDGTWAGLSSFLRAAREQVAVHGSGLSVTGRLFDVDGVQVTAATQPAGSAAPPTELEAILQLNAFDYGAPASPSATAGAASATVTTTTATTTTTGSGR